MTYNEQRYSSCACSLLKNILCPSFVDQPCSILATSSISDDEEDHHGFPTIEYYTNKRIECLHERMDEIQISSFVKFINYHLASKYDEDRLVKDLTQDLTNGHVFLDLIEIFSSTKFKREYGRTRFHSLTNVQHVLEYLKLHMQHINISPHEIVSGNRKQILALLWIMMKIFDFPSFRLTSTKHLFPEQTLVTGGHDRSTILKWLNHLFKKIITNEMILIKDFYISTWLNEEYLPQLIKYLAPFSGKCSTLEYMEYIHQCQHDDQSKEDKFQSYLNLSSFCFQTNAHIDYDDRTEKNLLRYFSDLYSQVFNLVTYGRKELIETSQHEGVFDEKKINDWSNDLQDNYLVCLKDSSLPLSPLPEQIIDHQSDPIVSDDHLSKSLMISILLILFCSLFILFIY